MPGMWLEPARADVGPYISLMSSFFLFSLLPSSCPLLAREAPPPPHAGHPATGSANSSDFTDIPARNSWTHTSLVQMLLTFSHCFWKGKQSLHFAAQTVPEGPRQSRGASGNGAHDHSSPTHWAADCLLGGRERCPLWSQDPHLLPLGSLMVGWVVIMSSITPRQSTEN